MVVTPSEPQRGRSTIIQTQAGAIANGSGQTARLGQFGGWTHVEIVKTGTGTASIAIQGSDDQVHWYPARYQQMDVEARPAEADAALALAAGAVAHVYQVLDHYPFLQTPVSSVVGSVVVNATVYAEAVEPA